jgi:hypothetical protein
VFVVSEEISAAVHAAYEQDGELSAATELRRHFPGIVNNTRARDCAQAIAGWVDASARSPVNAPHPQHRKDQ